MLNVMNVRNVFVKLQTVSSHDGKQIKSFMLQDRRSHGLSFFPWLPPDIDAVSADEDRTGIWVFLHGPSHPVF